VVRLTRDKYEDNVRLLTSSLRGGSPGIPFDS